MSKIYFLGVSGQIQTQNNNNYDASSIARNDVAELWNQATNARNKGNRLLAERLFEKCVEVEIPNRTPEDNAFRGMVLYNRSVNLLVHHGLSGSNVYPEALWSEVRTIVDGWGEFIELYEALPPGFATEFGSRVGFNAARALNAASNDPLMGFKVMKLKDGTLVFG